METDPVRSLIRHARETVLTALATPDIDAYLCAVVLSRDRPSWAADATASLLNAQPPGLRRSSDVAVVGLRHAIGVAPVDMAAFATALRKELSRQPLPPMTRAHEDQRLMLGVAAGVAIVPELLPQMTTEFGSVKRHGSLRWEAVLFWSKRLAYGEWDAATADAAAHMLGATAELPFHFDDAVAILALAADLFDTNAWVPDDTALAAVTRAAERARRVVVIDTPTNIEPFDAALVLRGLAALPIERRGRRSVLENVLATIDKFPAAVQLLADRPRHRQGLGNLVDEYDVQWLLHVLLLPVVPDLVPEDPAPKLAGASSRLDFASRAARLGIEIKHLKQKQALSRMREELMVDERQYQEHPYVEIVVGFVYDPQMHISLAERAAFERDLSVPVTIAGRTVNYVVRVR